MRPFHHRTSFLQKIYFLLYVILSAVIVLTPVLITGSVSITEKFIIDEEIFEVVLLGILFSLSLVIFRFYKQEAARQDELIQKMINEKKSAEEKLFVSMKYIGKVNVQIEEIKSIFNSTNAYPETKNDFKKAFRYLSSRVLGIVNTPWALMRIMDSKSRRTISECFETRQGFSGRYPRVSNKMIVEEHSETPLTTVMSNPHNLNILVCCTMPDVKINNDQRVFIQAIINEITMLFIILNSSYYKNENPKYGEKSIAKIPAL